MNVAGNKYDTSNYAYFYFRGTDDLRFFDRSLIKNKFPNFNSTRYKNGINDLKKIREL